jgi:hypothetical protein
MKSLLILAFILAVALILIDGNSLNYEKLEKSIDFNVF